MTDLIFCTLFNSNYIDKGIVLYRSMEEHLGNFKLYIFAFDDICYQILKNEKLKNAIIVSLKEFETLDLLEVKKNRSMSEYCWTCSPWIIKHVLERYNEHICTYIDSDMMFFSSPQCVFDDMRNNNCSIIIVPQRFKKEKQEKKAHDRVGSYCVEFNTFVNDENGNKALNWWAERCLEWCYYAKPGTTEWYGDQKYLNVFPEKFEGVYICNHYGLGLAPWNLCLVEEVEGENNPPLIKYKQTSAIYPVILHHYEYVSFITKHILNASSGLKSKKLFKEIYGIYIKRILNARNYIEKKYNIKISRTRRVNSDKIINIIYQKYIMPIRRIKRIKDLYWVK